MEDRINQGYCLFVEHNPEKQELVGHFQVDIVNDMIIENYITY